MTDELHLYCARYPASGGTHAAVGEILRALGRAGRKVLLVDPGLGVGEAPVDIARTPLFPWSVPWRYRARASAGRVALDLGMIAHLRRVARRHPGARLVAHHVEAAWVARAAGMPYRYVAHATLEDELPLGRARGQGGMRRLGRALDEGAVRHAEAAVAISPWLGARLGGLRTIPLPWSLPAPGPAREARATLRRILYAGNLDAYQGWSLLLDALEALRRRGHETSLDVATDADAAPLLAAAAARGLTGWVRVRAVATEGDRVAAHADADVALVPRLVPGGLPVKLLDALCRGTPTVAADTAVAGYDFEDTLVVAAAEGEAFADAIEVAFARRVALSEQGPRFIASRHGPAAFSVAWQAALR